MFPPSVNENARLQTSFTFLTEKTMLGVNVKTDLYN